MRAVANERALWAATDTCKDDISLDADWYVANERLMALKRLFREISSVSLSTAPVESDFSIVKAKEEDSQTAHTDLRFECLLQSKQYSMFASL